MSTCVALLCFACHGRREKLIHYTLSCQRDVAPKWIEFAVENHRAKCLEHIDLLRGGMSAGVFVYDLSSRVFLHVKVTTVDDERGILNVERNLAPVMW